MDGHTDLYIVPGDTVTAQICRDDILDPIVRPYAGAVGDSFILQDDNARPHRARLMEDYFREATIVHMGWPARSPDLNPIEHVWDALGRRIAALNPPPTTLQGLRTALTQQWALLPTALINTIILSMEHRCRACIAARSDHTPY